MTFIFPHVLSLMPVFKAVLVANEYYHVFNRAVGNEKIFCMQINYTYFLSLFQEYILPCADVFAFCLLPHHFHFFIRTKSQLELNQHMEFLEYRHAATENESPRFLLQQFSNLFNAYTKAFNKQQERKGKLFIEPFSRRIITSPEHYTKLIHYIHTNPVHHGLCKKPEHWPHSSYELIQRKTKWINYDEVIRWFGSMEEFIEFHKRPIERKF